MDEGTPTIVLAVTITLLVLSIGTFAFYFMYNEVGYSERQTETFNVNDPSVDQEIDLSYYPDSIVSVHQYNGFEWVEIPSAGYTVEYKDVTIDKDYLEG